MIPDALNWAIHDAPVANVEEWAVLVCMAGRADNDGCNTFQAIDTIAGTTRLSPDTVKRRQRAMRDRGLIGLGDQSTARKFRAGHRPTVYDLLVPYGWFGTSIDRINRDRAKDGLPPLTEEERPPLDGAPDRARRKDHGIPRKKPDDERPAADEANTPNEGGLQAPPPRGGCKHPHPDADEGASEGACGGACGGATSTPTYKEDLPSFGGKTLGTAADADGAAADVEADLLSGDFGKTRPSPAARRKQAAAPDPAVVQANAICSTWWNALPIKPSGPRKFANVAALVADDVRVGRSAEQIAQALAGCGVAVTRNALDYQYERLDRHGQPGKAAASGGMAARNNTDWTTSDAGFGMPR